MNAYAYISGVQNETITIKDGTYFDEDTEEKIIDIFKDLAHKEHKIVIIVTHSRQVADKADKVLALRRGKLS